jgi:predicted HicB family RNase H-like nuclease
MCDNTPKEATMSKTQGKARHCKAKYQQFNFRIRRDSELHAKVVEYLAEGESSLNMLLTRALCAYTGCSLPHREYSTYKRLRLI